MPDPFKELLEHSDEVTHDTALEVAVVEADVDEMQRKAAEKHMNEMPPHYK